MDQNLSFLFRNVNHVHDVEVVVGDHDHDAADDDGSTDGFTECCLRSCNHSLETNTSMFFSTRREGVRTSNDTLLKITQTNFVKITVKTTYGRLLCRKILLKPNLPDLI